MMLRGVPGDRTRYDPAGAGRIGFAEDGNKHTQDGPGERSVVHHRHWHRDRDWLPCPDRPARRVRICGAECRLALKGPRVAELHLVQRSSRGRDRVTRTKLAWHGRQELLLCPRPGMVTQVASAVRASSLPAMPLLAGLDSGKVPLSRTLKRAQMNRDQSAAASCLQIGA